jgi:RNA polymerase sigma factor (sigma-70 family)
MFWPIRRSLTSLVYARAWTQHYVTSLMEETRRPLPGSITHRLTRYMSPQCDGVKYEQLPSWEALWHKPSTGAPARQRQCVELRQKKAMKIESLDAGSEEDGHVSPAILRDWREVPSEALERKEVRQMIQLAVADLPGIYREIFLLRDVEELSVNESAEALGISVASVKVRLHRARMMLQKTLAPQLKQVNPKRRWFPWL